MGSQQDVACPVGAKVQRRSGSRAVGEVLAVNGTRRQVRWAGPARENGGLYDSPVWTEVERIKPAGQQSAHAAWCREQGRALWALVNEALHRLPDRKTHPMGGGTDRLYFELKLPVEEQHAWTDALRVGKVRSQEVYEAAITRMQSWLEQAR